MKSKSPFSKNTPLNKIEIFQGSTSTYRHPSTVIQPIVGAQIGKKLAEVGRKVAVDAINAKSDKEPRVIPPEVYAGTAKGINIKPQDVKATELEIKKENISKFMPTPSTSKKTLTQAYTDRDMGKYGGMSFEQYKAVAKQDPLYGTSGTKGGLKKMESTVTYIDGKKALQTPYKQAKNNSLAINMNGSPAKHNTETVGAINQNQNLQDLIKQPGSFISNFSKAIKQTDTTRGGVSAEGFAQQRAANAGGSTGVDPFTPPPNQVAETGSYSGGRDRILEMDSNPVVNQSIGRDTEISSQLFGSGQRASMLAMKGTPLHDKGHADDYEGHTHRKKGRSYKEGDYMDETDMETSYPKLHTQDVGEIKRDKKSQFMVSKNEDYSPTKIDTIRPLKGKEFKMGWGDAERNISTNPKYKKSK